MNRRQFIQNGLSGVALIALPGSALRSQPLVPAAPVVPPPPPMPPAALSGLRTDLAFQPLLDRARAALDRHKDRIVQRDRVALADFTAPSNEHRLHIVDLVGGSAQSYLVAHGRGSDPTHTGYLQSFSNEPNSLATSEGAYVTGDVYGGVHGVSMRLVGLEATNSNADLRAIVVHGAPYVSEDHIATFGKVGRSEGCFAVAPHLITQVLGLLGPSRLIYAAKI